MDMRKYEDLEKMLCTELEEIVDKGELTAGGLETVDKLLHSMKCLKKVMESEEGGGYSSGGDWSARGSYESNRSGGESYRYSRDGGMNGSSYNAQSYRRRRDSMGRYASAGDMDSMIQRLDQLMQNASGRDKEVMRGMIEELRGM